MEKHFLDAEVEGNPGFQKGFWYNPYGDCLEFYSENVAVVAERIDDIITIYRSAENASPVGCQIKGLNALVRLLDATHVRVDVAQAQNVVRHVRVEFAILAALRNAFLAPTAMRHVDQYAEFLGVMANQAHGQEVAVPDIEVPDSGLALAGS